MSWDDYLNPYGKDGIKCGECGEYFDMRNLSDVFKHEHKGLPLDDIMDIKGKEVKP